MGAVDSVDSKRRAVRWNVRRAALVKGEEDGRGPWEMRENVENCEDLVRNGCCEVFCRRRELGWPGRIWNSCCSVRRCKSRMDSMAAEGSGKEFKRGYI